ncbi:MAG: response regulator transcription factor [Deltaproteobacteria bacterium]|nr:response regulator transcription factor [Deltaproteobacteria bacterium]
MVGVESTGPILVVDDEADIRTLLAHVLGKEGFTVRAVATGPEALALAPSLRPGLVLLDLMLPGMQGTEVCRRLRAEAATASVPIIMLTARGDEVDRVVGFEVGADDYVTKPFSSRELVLRIRAVLRRVGLGSAEETAGQLRLGALRIDAAAHRAWVDDDEVSLTATEFRLLTTLARRSGRVLTRGQLLQEVWDMPPDLGTRTVDTHMKRLREKLGAAGDRIETVRGVGYRLNALAPQT